MAKDESSELIKVYLEESKKEYKESLLEVKSELKQLTAEIYDIKKELAISDAIRIIFDVPDLKSRIEALETKEASRSTLEDSNKIKDRVDNLQAWRNYLAGSIAAVVAIFWWIISNLDKFLK